MKQIFCKLCEKPFVCDNGMWFTTCNCAKEIKVCKMTVKKWPRCFEESSHQYFAKGVCYGLGFDKDGRPCAILEYESGEVRCRRLDEEYSIKLLQTVLMS